MTLASDDHERRRAIDERARNVLVEASAGTGKTTLVVERILALVAPIDAPPIPIERLAAITFTRKAAGELRVRTRQRILELLAALPAESPRTAPLHRALAGLDTAELGTIHSFADRLLRRWPAQARLDPRYALDDAPGRLVDECFERLVQAAEAGGLGAVLRGTPWEARGDEAAETILGMQRAGVPLRAKEREHWTKHGLDSLVAAFVRQRDVDVAEVALEDFDRATFDRFADELLERTDGVTPATRGGRWFVETAEILRRVSRESDPALLFKQLVPRLTAGPRGNAANAPRQRDDFPDDPRAWDLWKAFDRDTRTRGRVRDTSLRDDLLAPLRRWLAIRLVRLQPVVLHVYEQIKAIHEVVDHVDLLVRLRDLLRDEPAIRREAQSLYDHILVDEFQDTDPLQAEIIVYLCQRGAEDPAPGMLTLVGDPKQSIYRFRRADIEAYQHVIERVARAPHVAVRLAASWRSAPALVDWLNDRFAAILGTTTAPGEVAHAALLAGRTAGPAVTVHAVTLEVGDARKADDRRAIEADAMARYLRWLVERSGTVIEDPVTRRERALGYGDIAVLAVSTTQLRRLFDAFDRDRVPYAARGGTLFLSDPLHRTFLLGLVALADRDDGVARAALLRPPFFALDLADSARRCAEDPDDRWGQANEVVRELRRRRFERSVGATARALLEDTAIGRVVASGPNGAQRLTGLRELCIQLEARALDEQLDFDAAVERVRGWIGRPRQLERPHPIDGTAVRVLTIHQAKGLEFPVVMLWDACATWADRGRANDAWFVQRDGQGWALDLDQLRSEHPPGLGLAEREQRLYEAERKRLVYVAATRARDVLVVPRVVPRDDNTIIGRLLGEAGHATVLVHPPHAASAPAAWYVEATPAHGDRLPTTTRDAELRVAWESAQAVAGQGRSRPTAFTDAKSPRVFWGKAGRFGQKFGSVVHAAVGAALAGVDPSVAVAQAASTLGLRRHHAEAIADVERALASLTSVGVERDPQRYRLEYPVAGASPTGTLLAGYVDLVAMTRDGPVILDFKTDAVDVAIPDAYIAQVRGYARVVALGLGVTTLRAGLLFTSDGSVHWLSSEVDGAT